MVLKLVKGTRRQPDAGQDWGKEVKQTAHFMHVGAVNTPLDLELQLVQLVVHDNPQVSLKVQSLDRGLIVGGKAVNPLLWLGMKGWTEAQYGSGRSARTPPTLAILQPPW